MHNVFSYLGGISDLVLQRLMVNKAKWFWGPFDTGLFDMVNIEISDYTVQEYRNVGFLDGFPK